MKNTIFVLVTGILAGMLGYAFLCGSNCSIKGFVISPLISSLSLILIYRCIAGAYLWKILKQ